jgi:hypothetical protein
MVIDGFVVLALVFLGCALTFLVRLARRRRWSDLVGPSIGVVLTGLAIAGGYYGLARIALLL